MVQKAGSAMEGVDKSIDKLQAPLDTVVRLSGTIDQVQESAVGAVKNMAGFMAGNLDSAKEAAAARTAKKKPAPQPQPEPAAVTPAESEEPKTQSEGGTEHE